MSHHHISSNFRYGKAFHRGNDCHSRYYRQHDSATTCSRHFWNYFQPFCGRSEQPNLPMYSLYLFCGLRNLYRLSTVIANGNVAAWYVTGVQCSTREALWLLCIFIYLQQPIASVNFIALSLLMKKKFKWNLNRKKLKLKWLLAYLHRRCANGVSREKFWCVARKFL